MMYRFTASHLAGLLLIAVQLFQGLCYEISFENRAFTVDGQRTLFIAGSFHYPRATSEEWPKIIKELKENGINLIQTYVFWDIHEPVEGQYYFPNDGSSADLVKFLTECKNQDIFVNLRFGPYV